MCYMLVYIYVFYPMIFDLEDFEQNVYQSMYLILKIEFYLSFWFLYLNVHYLGAGEIL